jgi:hypothetical protein
MSETNTVSPLRQRMIEDMAARKFNPHPTGGGWTFLGEPELLISFGHGGV